MRLNNKSKVSLEYNPEMKEAAREQRRILQAKQLFKKSPAQSLVNPPDVCLELIILRERQLKAS